MDEAAKKRLLRTVPYGLYAASTCKPDGGYHLFLLSWLSQCSFNPPLVVCGVHKEAKAYKHLTATERAPMAISFLADDQKPLGQEILKKPAFDEVNETVAGTPYTLGDGGCPLLPETLGALELEVIEEAGEPGDHAALVCEVVEAHVFREGGPLTHDNTGWKYGG